MNKYLAKQQIKCDGVTYLTGVEVPAAIVEACPGMVELVETVEMPSASEVPSATLSKSSTVDMPRRRGSGKRAKK